MTSLQEETIDFGALDWLIMPCTGFDPRGYRLGMGGGFYDRALEHCEPRAPLRIGVAFAAQQASFEPDPWDQPFDWIVTEDRIYPPIIALCATVTAKIRPPITISILNGLRRFMHPAPVQISCRIRQKIKKVNFYSELSQFMRINLS